MKAPAGFTGSVSVNNATPPTSGNTYKPDANGFIYNVDSRDIIYLLSCGFTVQSMASTVIATADNGTTQTLTPAMVSGGAETVHTSAGGTTPSLTLPLAADLIAANPGLQVGDSYVLKVLNTNSGTATIVTNTGWTTSGTLTIATGVSRSFLVKRTGTATLSITNIGGGTV
jgi:hypothetical protein